MASEPSQRPDPPVIAVQKVDQEEPVSPPKVKLVVARLVDEALVANRLVVVALVPVAFLKVKFWRVVEPITRRSPEELMVVVAVPPMFRELAKMELEKRLVEVAWVVVERVMLLKMWAPVQVGEKV